MQQWWWSLVPIALMGLGYVAARFIEGRRQSERLKRKLDALALHRGMRRAGLTMRDLEVIERSATD